MEREPVVSSNLVSVGYDPASETLEVEFIKTGVYQYLNVPQFMWSASWRPIPSVGSSTPRSRTPTPA